jgi:glutamine synthetase
MRESTSDQLDEAQVKFARILWCDNANVIRAKAVHGKRLSAYLKHGVGISAAQQALPVMFDAPASGSGLGPVGEIRLVPDPQTLTMLPYAPGHAQFMGDMIVDGSPWSCCPRHFLKRMIAEAAAMDLAIMAAFENEFYLLRPATDRIVPADRTVFASTLSMDLQREAIEAIVDALSPQGVIVEQYYPESGPGQQELSIGYMHALGAADQQIIFRQTVHAVAAQHDRRASFAPKLFADHAGSGCHLHLSLWRNGENLVPDADHPGRLSSLSRKFLAGILAHLPALMALTTPSVNSYRRIRPHCWSGAYRCWGFDNREAAIRVPTFPEPPSPTHFELKTIDASANPYLALGDVIAAGAGYLAAVYPQVHVDFGLTVPFVSIAGMRSVLQQLLELAPTTKLLFSSDAHQSPELFYLGAKWGRETLADVLKSAVRDGDLSADEADVAAVRILHDNARDLYESA